MDLDSILMEGAFVVADFCLLGLCYKLYRNKVEVLKALQEAKHLDINKDLPKNVETAGGVIPYAVISGNVKALTTPLRSHHFSHLRGVIYERVTKERTLRWSPFFNVWDSAESAVQRNVINIPFGLSGGGFFKKQVVEVSDPLTAQELDLSEVYDDFKSYKESLSDVLMGYFRGEHTVGTHEVESMLLEDIPLTAVGKLTLENGKVKMMPPGGRLTYFLTPVSFDSLVDKIRGLAYFYKGALILVGAGTVILVVYNIKRLYKEIKRRMDHAKRLKRNEEARQQRRRNDPNRQNQENEPKCVICLENTVEVIVLECGHMCLCFDCSEHVNNFCPICRAEVDRFVPAFLP